MKRLDGMSVLVVDAGSDLVQAASARFSHEGARVAVADADPQAARDSALHLGPDAVPVALDPLDPRSCEEAASLAQRTFGALDVLCNRAPPAPSTRKRLHELSEAEWRSTLDAGLNAVALPTRYPLRVMSERGTGNVVVIGSAAGLVGVPLAVGLRGRGGRPAQLHPQCGVRGTPLRSRHPGQHALPGEYLG